jgi:hypothetical protein
VCFYFVEVLYVHMIFIAHFLSEFSDGLSISMYLQLYLPHLFYTSALLCIVVVHLYLCGLMIFSMFYTLTREKQLVRDNMVK